MFQYLLIDFDNTLYSYDECNNESFHKILGKISNDYKLDVGRVLESFTMNKEKYQTETMGTAASHHKLIQIKRLLEELGLPSSKSIQYYDSYLTCFNENLKLFPGVEDFLQLCKNHNIKLALLSNNMCREQLERLDRLGISHFFDRVYTSEEYGIEKPNINLLNRAMIDFGCDRNEIAIIGDSRQHDRKLGEYGGVFVFWFHKEFNLESGYLEFSHFQQLSDLFQEYYAEADKLVRLSRYVGERFDLVQAGGGNTSFKFRMKSRNIMFIKSSGCQLSELDINKNYVGVDLDSLKDNLTRPLSESIRFLNKYRPSIETTMHCLTARYTVHLHPIQFNLISGRPECRNIIKDLFQDYYFLDYHTPGIDVAKSLATDYRAEEIIFMKNHGVVFTSNNIDTIYTLMEDTVLKLEEYLNIDLSRYKYVNQISSNMEATTGTKHVSYLSEDRIIYDHINNQKPDWRPFFPDKVVYAGVDSINITYPENNELMYNIEKYMEEYNEIPKIFMVGSNGTKLLYITSHSLKKCQEIESVLKSHFMCVVDSPTIDYLPKKEIDFLNNWEAEKFRKKV